MEHETGCHIMYVDACMKLIYIYVASLDVAHDREVSSIQNPRIDQRCRLPFALQCGMLYNNYGIEQDNSYGR